MTRETHPSHEHTHGAGCGHEKVRHGDHEDYLHGAQRHAARRPPGRALSSSHRAA